MAQPARVLEGADVRRLIRHVRARRHASRDHVMVMLSFKAGLRACELAGLTWNMVLRPNGRVHHLLHVAGMIAKNGSARQIPVHPDLKAALVRLHAEQGCPNAGSVIRSERGGHMTPRSVVNWFARMYLALELHGASSHSGRRTAITRLARLLPRTGGSLRDVQLLVGHRDLATTMRYIDGSTKTQTRLIQLI